MVQAAVNASQLQEREIVTGSRSHERFEPGTLMSVSISFGVPELGMPVWVGELMAFGIKDSVPRVSALLDTPLITTIYGTACISPGNSERKRPYFDMSER